MTAHSIEESQALTLDFDTLAKVAEAPGVLPSAAHIPHVPMLISARFPSLPGELCGHEAQHIGNYMPCNNTACQSTTFDVPPCHQYKAVPYVLRGAGSMVFGSISPPAQS